MPSVSRISQCVPATARMSVAVTPESATAAYESLVDVDALTLVIAGDAAVVRDPLIEAGFLFS